MLICIPICMSGKCSDCGNGSSSANGNRFRSGGSGGGGSEGGAGGGPGPGGDGAAAATCGSNPLIAPAPINGLSAYSALFQLS